MGWFSIINRFAFGAIVAIGLMVTALPASAADVGTDFYSQCPVLFAQADSFAQSCLLNARPYKRYFNYEPESHNAYLGAAAPGSHFALGCTLNGKHQIAFLGIYYAMDGNDFKLANTAPIASVDFWGNIAEILNGQLVNFIAIRPFETKTIPLLYYDPQRGAKNCDKPNLPSGIFEDMQGLPYAVSVWHDGNKLMVKNCIVDGECLPQFLANEYLEVIKGADFTDLFVPTMGGYARSFVEANGGFLVEKSELGGARGCPYYYKLQSQGEVSMGVFQEVCIKFRHSLNLTP